ncbi:hypothetical protein HT574_07940 [Parageobacillus sp. VR-IP]|uniref:hypothetical protein n=1 Tax=Parageobacillus sp. VR-IP TaxID=2742205 RepID=UPI00158279B3|nr:hypothetical protein [Parageobacillus sp. VR-IP]
MVDKLVANAQKALEQFRDYDQETINHIVKEMALAGLNQHMALAKLAVEETKRGVASRNCLSDFDNPYCFARSYFFHRRDPFRHFD